MSQLHLPPPPLSSQSMADLMCNVMVFCQGQNEHGHDFWAYVCIKPSMAKAFREACESGTFNLENYGTVVEYGEGEEVPEHVRNRMEQFYGANHNYETVLQHMLETL
jgi:hypothetical protein